MSFPGRTVSRRLADAMARLFGDLGIVARLLVGRTTKSTVGNYTLVIAGADQVEQCAWLFPDKEFGEIVQLITAQKRRIAPTGYRRLSKNAAWVQVESVVKRHYEGPVYSLRVPDAKTVVTTHGLVVGQCFPKDAHALVRIAEDAGYDFALLKSVIDVNLRQYDKIADKIRVAAGGSLQGKSIGVWGLTFKANTDDLRDSPALYVIERLLSQGAAVKGYDITQTRELAPTHPTLNKIEVAQIHMRQRLEQTLWPC